MISIITPTYNRGYIIENLYNSLINQSVKHFEWIVVDDGSTDNTRELIKKYITETYSFNIHYIYQKNGGKHRAVNTGVSIARYDYCFIVDSDDFLVDNAIELIIEWIETINNEPDFAGVAGLKGYIRSGEKIGRYPKHKRFTKYIDATNLERKKFHLSGDKAEVYRKDILKRYPFPEFQGENFITEEVVWDAIARDGYKIRWFNKVIYLCEYNEDGLTRMGESKFINNFNGYTYAIKQRMKLHGFLERQFAAGEYMNYAKKKGLNLKDSADNLEITLVYAVLVYMVWNLKKWVKLVGKIAKHMLKNQVNVNE